MGVSQNSICIVHPYLAGKMLRKGLVQQQVLDVKGEFYYAMLCWLRFEGMDIIESRRVT